MPHYLIVSPHTEEDCSMVVKQTLAIGYLTHFHWGCKSGDHTAYAMIEADNEKEAMLSIPTVIRSKGSTKQVTQFTPEDVQKW